MYEKLYHVPQERNMIEDPLCKIFLKAVKDEEKGFTY